MRDNQIVSTFSIVACDLAAGEWGVAVQSKFLGVGSVVPWAKAGVGAVATQARANTTYGPRGLELMESGVSAPEAVRQLTAADPDRAVRQVAMVDANGNVSAFTGPDCMNWAGHVTGKGFSCQGNILAGPQVVEGIANAYCQADGDLADRLIAALQGGQTAGGDSRGRQSAAIMVVKEKGGYNGFTDRYFDLRVEDHLEPIEELKRIVELYRFVFLERKPESIPYSGTILYDLQGVLRRLGYYQGDLDGRTDVSSEVHRYANEHQLSQLLRTDNRISTELILQMRSAAMAK